MKLFERKYREVTVLPEMQPAQTLTIEKMLDGDSGFIKKGCIQFRDGEGYINRHMPVHEENLSSWVSTYLPVRREGDKYIVRLPKDYRFDPILSRLSAFARMKMYQKLVFEIPA